ncbi:MAG: carboxy terminal-processing peptidase [Desulfamplus sp.]|nr:carboxy terminal-processing peptidase [Desulfamplus sp.]
MTTLKKFLENLVLLKVAGLLSIILFVLIFITPNFSLALDSPSYLIEGKAIGIGGEIKKVTFSKYDADICVSIVAALERSHYLGLKFNDNLSSKILNQYINILDPAKNLFTIKEINEFEKIRYWLDNTLKKGDLTPGYTIFNIYLERSYEKLSYINKSVETWQKSLSFDQNDEIDLDRKDAPWPIDKNELQRLWEHELKNTIISLKLEQESDDDITNLLSKRYKSRLNRLVQTNSEDAFKTYINAVAMSFDPHTQFFPPRMSEDFDIQMSLSLEGIGAVLQTEYEYTKVVSLIPAGPADKSGLLMPGDKIIGVGQGLKGAIQDTVGWRIDEVVNLIRGPKDSFVTIKIIPVGQKGSQNFKIITIKRDKVKLEEQAASKKIIPVKRNGQTFNIGVITIPTFYLDFKGMQEGTSDYRSTTRDVFFLLEELKKENIQGLIIDLRDNGGGALQEANQLTGLFIKSGPTVQIRSRNGYMSRLEDIDPSVEYAGPLVVIVNRMSASASEIFAGAIRDYNRGLIVGNQTFGKGTVQALQPIENGQLKLTNAKFYRVSGESTQNLGILPDIEFPSIYNSDETGESSLDGALLWDKSERAQYKPYPDTQISYTLSQLKDKHLKRIDKNPDFAHLRERYELSKEIYNLKSLSLNIAKRKEYKEYLNRMELEIENRLRRAKGQEPLTSIEQLQQLDPRRKGVDDEEVVPEKPKKEDKDDVLLKEAEEIMADFVTVAQSKGYKW